MDRILGVLMLLCVTAGIHAGAIVCDLDLTKQTSGGDGAVVTKGSFANGGWINSNGGRVLFTSPQAMRKGWAEITFIVDDVSTNLQNEEKCIFFSIYDCSAISQGGCTMKAYTRIRSEPDRPYYIEFKARDIKQLNGEGETRLNSRNDWNNHKGKEVRLKLMWGNDMVVTLEYPKQDGSGYATVTRGSYKITNIKYVVVGADGSYNCTFTGFRYTGLKVYNEDATGGVTEVTHQAVEHAHTNDRFRFSGNEVHFTLESYETAALYDLRGVMIRSITTPFMRIDQTDLTPGQYFLSINGGHARNTIPIVIK